MSRVQLLLQSRADRADRADRGGGEAATLRRGAARGEAPVRPVAVAGGLPVLIHVLSKLWQTPAAFGPISAVSAPILQIHVHFAAFVVIYKIIYYCLSS